MDKAEQVRMAFEELRDKSEDLALADKACEAFSALLVSYEQLRRLRRLYRRDRRLFDEIGDDVKRHAQALQRFAEKVIGRIAAEYAKTAREIQTMEARRRVLAEILCDHAKAQGVSSYNAGECEIAVSRAAALTLPPRSSNAYAEIVDAIAASGKLPDLVILDRNRLARAMITRSLPAPVATLLASYAALRQRPSLRISRQDDDQPTEALLGLVDQDGDRRYFDWDDAYDTSESEIAAFEVLEEASLQFGEDPPDEYFDPDGVPDDFALELARDREEGWPYPDLDRPPRAIR